MGVGGGAGGEIGREMGGGGGGGTCWDRCQLNRIIVFMHDRPCTVIIPHNAFLYSTANVRIDFLILHNCQPIIGIRSSIITYEYIYREFGLTQGDNF